nr:hypothetical protein GCM10020093_086340 [Planobispora longispora]
MTLIGRYYERYADHAVRVARDVVYLVTGSRPHGDANASLLGASNRRLPSTGPWRRRRVAARGLIPES